MAGDVALAVIERAEAGGEWTVEDRVALHAALANASLDEQRRALGHFAVAVNQQRLRLAPW